MGDGYEPQRNPASLALVFAALSGYPLMLTANFQFAPFSTRLTQPVVGNEKPISPRNVFANEAELRS
jgi:hypothetical protein